MKGLSRGLRYITQIFDEKEPEIEIGFPTDVKHVAHIGSDGPSASKPSWMNDFQSAPELSDGTSNSMEEVKSRSVLSLPPDASQGEKQKRRSGRKSDDGSNHSRRQTITDIADSPANSPTKSSRRRRSSNTSMDSPGRDSGSSRGARQRQTPGFGGESPARDQPSIPRHSRGRKTKESSRLKDKSYSSDMPPCGDGGPEEAEQRVMPVI